MADYLLRDTDESLWTKFKKRAKSDELPLRTVLIGLVKMYVNGEVTIRMGATPVPVPAPVAPARKKAR